VGVTGTKESDVALTLARRVARGLDERLHADVLLTRSDDTFVPLRERAALANQNDADLFLSIHANAAPASTLWGVETYSLDAASDAGAARVAARENALAEGRGDPTDRLFARLLAAGNDVLSRGLAAEIQARVVSELATIYGSSQARDLGAKTALFAVLVSTRMPAVLFEASFLSNPADERRLRTPHAQQAIADAIVDAVGRWLARQR
jgi:N-acetylmuramoyl-L-alanine amidase